MDPQRCNLDDLEPGQRATVVEVRCSEPELRHKLLVMGIVKGVDVKLLRRAPFGDPVVVELLGYSLGLRLSEAASVVVSRSVVSRSD